LRRSKIQTLSSFKNIKRIKVDSKVEHVVCILEFRPVNPEVIHLKLQAQQNFFLQNGRNGQITNKKKIIENLHYATTKTF
jgi:hypothetical protein